MAAMVRLPAAPYSALALCWRWALMDIIHILDGGESTIQFTGRSIIAFLSPVNCIVDELPSKICYIIHICKILTMLL